MTTAITRGARRTLLREAAFTLVFGSRPGIKTALLERFTSKS
ncbi:hypothetical protein [Nocardia pneumoniae]|nr:hypothetical protein [Nocardia pneumoniae]